MDATRGESRTASGAAPPRDALRAPLAVLGIVAAGLVAVLCFAYPPLKSEPRDLPIGLAGPAAATAPIAQRLGQGGAFEVRPYPDAAAARAAVLDREVYGAIAAGPGGPRLLVASAASPAVAQALQAAAARQGGAPMPVEDVVPGAPGDPRGAGLAAAMLPLVLLGVGSAAALGRLERGRAMRAVWISVLAALAGLGVVAVMQGWLDALAGDAMTNAAALALVVGAVGLTGAGLARWLGLPGLGLVALTLVLVGNPGSGAQAAPETLPEPWRALGPFLPPGAGTDLLRGVAYFDGAGVAGSLAVLAAWVAAGALLLLVPGPDRGGPAPAGRP
ncbi:ABC transporter permease [Bailinhaonella thermotolerans]|uniref:ABC transporter permease n=1 Tax=Bailinhaonella thermotolerans TaxID=1070861 RepID=A0A3A4BIF9_9ACTN|nr:ABC transporter permease [Bailinhaonella thermotolerans]